VLDNNNNAIFTLQSTLVGADALKTLNLTAEINEATSADTLNVTFKGDNLQIFASANDIYTFTQNGSNATDPHTDYKNGVNPATGLAWTQSQIIADLTNNYLDSYTFFLLTVNRMTKDYQTFIDSIPILGTSYQFEGIISSNRHNASLT
jgi:hypothetical protein